MTRTRKRGGVVQSRRGNRSKRKKAKQRGRGVDAQKFLSKLGELHWPGYQFMGPGTKLKKRLAKEQRGINRLDNIAMRHDIDYSKAKNLQDKHKADQKMINAITKLPGKKTWTEAIVKKIMQAKKRLGI